MKLLLLLALLFPFTLFNPIPAFADCTIDLHPTGSPTGSENVGFGTANRFGANKFTAGCTGTVSTVTVSAKKTGSPTAFTPAIYSDSAGVPNASLGSANSYTPSSTSCTNDTLTFGTPVSVTSGVVYWVVLTNGTNDSSNFLTWCSDGGATGSAGDYKSGDTTPTWSGTDSGTKMNFTIVSAAAVSARTAFYSIIWW